MKNHQGGPNPGESASHSGPSGSAPRRGMLDVFIANQAALRGFIARFMVSSHDIDDVSQEAFLRAYKAEQQTPIDQPKAFLFKVAKNILLNELGRKSRKVTDYVPDLEALEVLSETDTLETNLMAQQRLGIYCEAVASLPTQCRRVMLMKKVYGLTTKEVARRLGITTSTVEKHLTKALKDCNAVLAERYKDSGALTNTGPGNSAETAGSTIARHHADSNNPRRTK